MNSTATDLKITTAQLKCLHTLVSKRGITTEEKAAMVIGYTNGRSESSKGLYFNEAALMIQHLQSMQPNAAAATRMRNKVLYYAHEMNWRINGKLNMPRVDEWCKKFGYLHKPLDQYEYAELPKLITQIEFVYNDYLKKL